MLTPEIIIITINFIILLILYGVVCPAYFGFDFKKLVIYDSVASGVSVVVAGKLYWNTGVEFNVLLGSVNWFWFSVLAYLLLEIPFYLRYSGKNQVQSTQKNDH
jgi:hypothetical protein